MSNSDKMFIEMFAYLELKGMRPLVAVSYIDMANSQRVVNRFPIVDEEQYKDSFNQGKYVHGQRVDGKIVRGQKFKINGFFLDPNDYSY
jgi:hypothetical protein